jgi:lysophospholipase
MVAPATSGVPRWAAGAVSELMCLAGKGRECNLAQKPYDGADGFGESWCCATSDARYHWYWEFVREHENYQNSAASYRWLKESVFQTGGLLSRKNTRRCQVPVLLLQAGQDTMVDNGLQDKLVERLPRARKVIFQEAGPEISNATDERLPCLWIRFWTL